MPNRVGDCDISAPIDPAPRVITTSPGRATRATASATRAAMNSELQRLAAAQIPGDTYRNLQIQPTFSNQTFKHVLVPIWLLTYNYGARPFRLLVNGYTGKMAGEYPKSVWKIALLVVLALIVVLIVLWLQD